MIRSATANTRVSHSALTEPAAQAPSREKPIAAGAIQRTALQSMFEDRSPVDVPLAMMNK
jgi:hypothetical protein